MANEPKPEKLKKLNRLEDLSNRGPEAVIAKGRPCTCPRTGR